MNLNFSRQMVETSLRKRLAAAIVGIIIGDIVGKWAADKLFPRD